MELFYRMNPKLIQRYQPYMTEWKKNSQDSISDIGWTNGLYVGRAISASFPKGKAYPSEPLKLYSSPDSEEKSEPVTDADRFAGFAAMFNKQFQMRSNWEVGDAIDDIPDDSIDTL